MPEYSVKLLGMAEDDFDEICEYLSRFYPGTVGRFLEDLEESFDRVAYNPRMYQPYEWDKEYRRIVIGDYLAFYKVDDDEKRVDVYRILHGKRNIPEYLE
jgi:plasmid stabilization system protein ParE